MADIVVPDGDWTRDRRVVENRVSLLPLKLLRQLRGNGIRRNNIADIKAMLVRDGLREPVILTVDTKNRLAGVLDLNHRVVALSQLGYTHAPVVIVKATLSLVPNDDSPWARPITLKPNYDSDAPTAVSLGLPGALPT